MYRYQPTANDFGNNSWACHQRCGDYTMWRVANQDVGLVPAHDAPEGWGVRDEWLAQVREQRRRELAEGGAMPRVGGGGGAVARSDIWNLVAPLLLLLMAKFLGWVV